MANAFTIEQFHGVFGDYNTAVWPAQLFRLGVSGELCFSVSPMPHSVLIVPVLWCLVGSQAAFFLGVQPELGPVAVGGVGVLLLAMARQPHDTYPS